MSTDTKPRPVRIAGALLAAVSIIGGGITSVSGLEENAAVAMWAGLVMLVAGALTATLIPVLEDKVVPVQDVATYLNGDRRMVDGPAADQLFTAEIYDVPGRHTDTGGDGFAGHAQDAWPRGNGATS